MAIKFGSWAPALLAAAAVALTALAGGGCQGPPGEQRVPPEALPKPGAYIGASRADIVAMCGYFPHYGLEGMQSVIGGETTLFYFLDESQALGNEALMGSPVWRVNFQAIDSEHEPGFYRYDELTFGGDDRVEGFRSREVRFRNGAL